MQRIEERVLDYVNRFRMIEEGDRILLGLSGGADSVCLLFLLQWLKKRIPFELGAVHVNHNLRGEEAVRDQEAARSLCQQQQVPFFLVQAQVRQLAARRKLSLEEAGRQARIEAFEEICRSGGYGKIALAHHRDDLAETMLYHLARGTGISGLCSLRPVRGNRIRPLLCLGRAEIEEWLRGQGIPWQTDSTNLDDSFTRNKIRHHVADYLVREINPEAAAHMAQTAMDLQEMEELTEQMVGERLRRMASPREGGVLLSGEAAAEPAVLRRRMLLKLAAEAAGEARDLTREHAGMLDALWQRETGKRICLPGGVRARREYGGIWIGREDAGETLQKGKEDGRERDFPLQIPGTVRLGEWEITCRIVPNDFRQIEEKKYTKWLDYDRIEQCPKIRHRQPHDRFAAHPAGSKKLKDYLIDRKIPQKERDDLWLVADGSEILWVIGDRISQRYKVGKTTQRVLYIQIKGGNIHE